jgi:hypothetical protein
MLLILVYPTYSQQEKSVMKKILTIAATTGVALSAFAGLAHAQTTVNLAGPVSPYCAILSGADGTLQEDVVTGATSLATLLPASVVVKCNSTTSKLDLTTNGNIIPGGQTPAPSVTFGFTGTGTGIYNPTNAGLQTFTANNVTTNLGDTANISASVTASPTKLLAVGSYTVGILATLVP